MPCYDPDSAPDAVRKAALYEFTHNSPVAEMLCAMCAQVEKLGIPNFIYGETAKWWADHKERDEAKKDSGIRTTPGGIMVHYQFTEPKPYENILYGTGIVNGRWCEWHARVYSNEERFFKLREMDAAVDRTAKPKPAERDPL